MERSAVLKSPREINAAFVAHAVTRTVENPDPHIDYATRRLGEGADEYGEFGYRERDPAAEAAEEMIDGANWLGFEFVKRLEAGEIGGELAHLQSAAAHAALAFEQINTYLDKRKEPSG